MKKRRKMGKKPSIKKNYVYKLLYEILTIITSFITAPYVSRALGADGIGKYSYTSSFMAYFTMFAVLGTSTYGMREIARYRDDKYQYSKIFWEIEILTVFTTLFSLIAWLTLTFNSVSNRIYFMALTPSLIAILFDISWFYIGHEKVSNTVVWNLICKILGVVCIFIFVREKQDLVKYIVLQSLITLLGNMSMWIYLPRMLVKVNSKEFELKKHIKETLIYFIPTIATSIYQVLDKTLIGVITKNSYENGYYEQANKIISMVKTAVYGALNSVMSSRLSFLFVENKVIEIRYRINSSMDYILFLGMGATFGIVGIAKTFVPVFFGDGYEQVVVLLYFMAPLLVIIGVSNCLGSHYYTPAGKIKAISLYMVMGSIANLCANLFLIPRYQALGAVFGSLIAEGLITFLFVFNARNYFDVGLLLIMSWKKIFAGIIMLLFIKIIDNYIGISDSIKIVLEILMGVVIYCCILNLLHDKSMTMLTRQIQEIKAKWEILKRKNNS